MSTASKAARLVPAKRKAFLHIGLDDGSGDFLDDTLAAHPRALAELGVRRPARSREEMFRVALEILRTHREWGYRRAEVEGAWSQVVRRGLKGKETLVFSEPMLAAAQPEQVDLMVDALAGFEVHAVVTASAPDAWAVPGDPGRDLGTLLDRWTRAVRRSDRLHVVVTDHNREVSWRAFGRVVGFGTASLPVTEVAEPPKPRPPYLALPGRAPVLTALGQTWAELLASSDYDVVGDPTRLVPVVDPVQSPEEVVARAEGALCEALGEVERLARRNESLEVKVDELEKKSRARRRRLSQVG